jgi:hypothetical protein
MLKLNRLLHPSHLLFNPACLSELHKVQLSSMFQNYQSYILLIWFHDLHALVTHLSESSKSCVTGSFICCSISYLVPLSQTDMLCVHSLFKFFCHFLCSASFKKWTHWVALPLELVDHLFLIIQSKVLNFHVLVGIYPFQF